MRCAKGKITRLNDFANHILPSHKIRYVHSFSVNKATKKSSCSFKIIKFQWKTSSDSILSDLKNHGINIKKLYYNYETVLVLMYACPLSFIIIAVLVGNLNQN